MECVLHILKIKAILIIARVVVSGRTTYLPCGIATVEARNAFVSVGHPPKYTNAMAMPNSMPWNVMVESNGERCGGVLFRLSQYSNSSDLVLSSSQCFWKKEGVFDHTNATIVLGFFKYPPVDDAVTVRVKSVTATPFDILKKDIALVTLESEVVFTDKVRPICLPNSDAEIPVSEVLHLTGWKMGTEKPRVSHMMHLEVHIMPTSLCELLFPNYSSFDHICGEYVDRFMCNGTLLIDFGSPLIKKYGDKMFIIGMYNGELRPKGSNERMLYFSRISTSIDWIIRSYYPSQ
ncbi:putative trypsin [Trichinella spiralis]|uniref:putative trypsin n=1 Tax=Trichinella spiralis TaxID=6334 RepID=UPI0001EFD0C3|nr:putative trypsin [Trichinella spiralis]